MDEGRYNIQEDYQLTAEDRERAFFEKMKREGRRWAEHTKPLAKLEPGQSVLMQQMRGIQKGKWTVNPSEPLDGGVADAFRHLTIILRGAEKRKCGILMRRHS